MRNIGLTRRIKETSETIYCLCLEIFHLNVAADPQQRATQDWAHRFMTCSQKQRKRCLHSALTSPEKDCYDHIITCKNDALQVPVRRTRGATPPQRVQQHNARGSVIGRCWDDFWWRSPACRRHSRKCIPLMTGGTRWGTEEISLVVVKRVFSSRWLQFWLGLWVWPGYDSGCPGGPGTQGTREGPREATIDILWSRSQWRLSDFFT